MQTGAPDVVVVPATTLATLRQQDWEVPASIDRLAAAMSLSRRADRAADRAAARLAGTAKTGR
jgi:Zn-dependent protease with chaperone function